MFVFGTDGGTLRAWPIHTIKSVTYNPKGSGPAAGSPELAIHFVDGSISWLRGAEAAAVWAAIEAKGIGRSSGNP